MHNYAASIKSPFNIAKRTSKNGDVYYREKENKCRVKSCSRLFNEEILICYDKRKFEGFMDWIPVI